MVTPFANQKLAAELKKKLSHANDDDSSSHSARNRGASFTLKRQEDRSREVGVFQAEALAWISQFVKTGGDKGVTMDDIRTGVPLLEMLKAINPALEPKQIKRGDQKFFWHENMKVFLETAKKLGVEKAVVFDTAAIVDCNTKLLPRGVLLCLLQFALKAHQKYGSPLPDIVKLELEIERLRRIRKEKQREELLKRRERAHSMAEQKGSRVVLPGEDYIPAEDDEVDALLAALWREYSPPFSVERIDKVQYIFGFDPSTVYDICAVRGVPLVRIGDQWQDLGVFLEKKILQHINSDGGLPAIDEEEAAMAPYEPLTEEEAMAAIEAISEPHDVSARKLGQRWLHRSGAFEKKMKSEKTYREYLQEAQEDGNSHDSESMLQIRKDVIDGRTDARCFTLEDLRTFLLALSTKDSLVITRVTNILTAFVKRNKTVGYAQGLNNVTHFLLAFLPEEDAFWLLCAMVEDLRSLDFYSRDAPSMNGFLVAAHVLSLLVVKNFPHLVEHLGQNNVFALSQFGAQRWMIDLYIDSVPLKTNICILDTFFHKYRLIDEIPLHPVPQYGMCACCCSSRTKPDVPEEHKPENGEPSKTGADGAEAGKAPEGEGAKAPAKESATTVITGETESHSAGGDIALARAALVIMRQCVEPIRKADTHDEAYEIVLRTSRTMPYETMYDGLHNTTNNPEQRWFSLAEYKLLALTRKQEVTPGQHDTPFELLARNTEKLLTKENLAALRAVDREERKDGADRMVSKEEFLALLQKCGVPLNPTQVRWLFAIYNKGAEKVAFRPLAVCLHILTNDSVNNRLRACFQLYSEDGTAAPLTPAAAAQLLDALVSIGRHAPSSPSASSPSGKEGSSQAPQAPRPDISTLEANISRKGERQQICVEDVAVWVCEQPAVLQCFHLPMDADASLEIKDLVPPEKESGIFAMCSGGNRNGNQANAECVIL